MEISNSKLTVAIVTICLLNFTTGLSSSPLKDSDTLALENLGMIEGKVLYAEADQNMTWEEAGNYCNAVGLRLATVENRNQSLFLANAIKARYGEEYFWIAGRDSRLIGSMQWNTTGRAPESNIFDGIRHSGGTNYTYCAVVGAEEALYLFMDPCTDNYKVLCELV